MRARESGVYSIERCKLITTINVHVNILIDQSDNSSIELMFLYMQTDVK